MASGTIKGTFTATAATNVYPEIRWQSTKNDANNNSSVTAELWFVKVNSYWYPYNLSGYTSNIDINGNNASASRTFDLRNRNSQMIWSRTVTVAHDADGNKSITISSGGSVGLSNMGSVSVSGTAKLDTIPRASSISSISGNQIGGNITVNISRASSSFTHRVGYYDTDGQRRSEILDATTSATFAIPLDRCNLLPNSTSGVAEIVVDTYSGSTKIGSVSKSHTVYVPSSVVPVVNSFNIAEGITKVANVKLPANNFVQNMSRLDMAAGASGKYNSTIKDYTFSFNGQSQGGMSERQFNAGSANGTYTANVEVTDSRGRKASKSVSVTVHKYDSPSINNFKIYRVDQTTEVKADINFTVTNINSLGGSWSIQKLVGTTWTNTNTGTLTTTHSSTGLVVVGTYDVTKSQNFRVVLSDAFGTGATANGSISTAKTLLDFNKDIGIGIGKMHENGALDVGGTCYFEHINSTGDASVKYLTVGESMEVRSGASFGGPIDANGGFGSRRISSGANLNGYTQPGFYHCPSDADANTMTNLPNTSAFSLFVERHAGVKQTFTTHFYNDFKIWTRNLYAGVWGSWVRTNVDYHYEAAVSFPDGNFESYSNIFNDSHYAKFYVRNHSTVTLTGAVKNKIEVDAGWLGIIAKLPAWVAPRHRHLVLAQGSGNNMFLLEIQTNGNIVLSRYRNSASNNSISVGSWLNIDCTYNISSI